MSDRPTIGLLQCGDVRAPLSDTHGDYPELYVRLLGPGFDWRVFRVHDGDIPDDPTTCDGWLVSGSRHGAYEDHDWIAPLETLIRSIHGTRPLIGICFGHQIIAQALGGRVQKYSGGWAVGRRAYDWAGRTVHLNAWHQDQVVMPPPGATTILTNPFTIHAGLAMGDTLTLQPHPEFPPALIADMIPAVGRGTVPDDLLTQASADLPLPVDNALTGDALAAHFRRTIPWPTG
ncbi:GMP synthase [glutamine-hydrolyzing] [Rhodobacteraceae bacterium THAF1]|uniref:type 1 glutamine amidotransferase n=1 Tax=Palleronia sp. THAF1 TaxID=2587842 RepID=UPI000F3F919B|nr:type 1 glutamine amidotransferase [Palleronia sp. THAF1]QFU09392.1 GMP synthase [glutamine-hydrolyzing] [Palleronia sp. THAF1]VDC22001.1 GMP synthase [glutamine-hydrolyzing] [Rhodobacteraceae bacterium THAF1]